MRVMLLSFQDCIHQFHPPQFLQNLPTMDNGQDTRDMLQGTWNIRTLDTCDLLQSTWNIRILDICNMLQGTWILEH